MSSESERESSDQEETVNQSAKYLYSLKTQYDNLMKEGEQVFRRHIQYKKLRSEIAKMVDTNGNPIPEEKRIKGIRLPPDFVSEAYSAKDLKLDEIEINIWPYMYEEIAVMPKEK